MIVGGYPDGLAEWLVQQLNGTYFPLFLAEIEERSKSVGQLAITKGETEHEKGQAVALQWVLSLPQTIIDTRVGQMAPAEDGVENGKAE